ncbi:cation:proton antiporter [Halovenus rubra]|uniref:Cation:proton antiporter n=2 Tax=Halovenus rubra TaxID=869890 RepID=A0ABD5X256_9EURY
MMPILFLSGDAMTDVFLLAAAVFMLLATAMLYRVIKGPSTQDRVLAVNVLGTNTVVVLALLGAGLDVPSLLDIALVYALLNFLMSVAISKFTVEQGGVL